MLLQVGTKVLKAITRISDPAFRTDARNDRHALTQAVREPLDLLVLL